METNGISSTSKFLDIFPFREYFKVSRFLVSRFLETQKPPKTAGNRKLNVQIADVSRNHS
jgi:hypothetical protein